MRKYIFYMCHILLNDFTINHIIDNLYISSIPKNRDDWNLIKKLNIDTVITLNEEWELSLIDYAKGIDNINIYNFSTPDYNPVKYDDILKILFYIHENKNNVLVHCKAGIGRSGMIIICYLIYYYSMEPNEAYIRARKGRNKIKFRYISKQWNEIMNFYLRTKKNK